MGSEIPKPTPPQEIHAELTDPYLLGAYPRLRTRDRVYWGSPDALLSGTYTGEMHAYGPQLYGLVEVDLEVTGGKPTVTYMIIR